MDQGARAGDGTGPSGDAVSSWLSGTAGDVVQARDVSGGVHFHTGADPAARPPRQLPAPMHGFVGRSRELARLEALLADGTSGPRLVVIVGTAGAGKTSLAVHLAHRVRGGFPDGQLFVNLHGYDAATPLGPAAVLERFLRALGVMPAAIPAEVEERAEMFRSLTAGQRILVVLDNAATVGQVRPLLPGDSEALVLVTSRHRLPGLSARDGAHRLTLGLLSDAEATALIAAATTDYRDPDDPGQVAELARLCARLPLALRIAAERAAARPWMPLTELIADLRSESSLWDALSTEDEAEADAVRTVFAWSYRALPLAAARVFRLLGLHPGPDFSAATAAALTGEETGRVSGLLDALAGAHLLEQTGPDRFQFHDLLRAYALTQVHQEDSAEQQRDALARAASWYLHTADAAARTGQNRDPSVLTAPANPRIRPLDFPDQASASQWYLLERANLVALAHAAVTAGLDDIVWQMSVTLSFLHEAHLATDDWILLGQMGVEAAARLGDRAAQAVTLQTLAIAYIQARRLTEAFECHRQAAEAFTEIGDPVRALRSVNGLGVVHLRRHELRQAAARFAQTAELARHAGAAVWQAQATDNLAATSAEAGEYDRAVELAKQALELYEQAGSGPVLTADAVLTLARAHRETGRLQDASRYLDQAERIIADGAVYRVFEAVILLERGALEQAQGQGEQALETYWRSARLATTLGDRSREARSYDGAGQALRMLDRTEQALDFHTRAAAVHRHLDDSLHLALTLSHLAEALTDLGRTEDAEAARTEAAALIEGFDDPRAEQLRTSLTGP